MRSRRTARTNRVFKLGGGNEDNDLFVRETTVADYFADDPSVGATPVMASVWEPSQEERAELAAGANLELAVVGGGHPPVSLSVTHEGPTANPQAPAGPRVWVALPGTLALEVLEVLERDLEAGHLPTPELLETAAGMRRALEAAIRQDAEGGHA